MNFKVLIFHNNTVETSEIETKGNLLKTCKLIQWISAYFAAIFYYGKNENISLL